jgi:hypothetical protein
MASKEVGHGRSAWLLWHGGALVRSLPCGVKKVAFSRVYAGLNRQVDLHRYWSRLVLWSECWLGWIHHARDNKAPLWYQC